MTYQRFPAGALLLISVFLVPLRGSWADESKDVPLYTVANADSGAAAESHPRAPVFYDDSPRRELKHAIRYEKNPRNEFLETLRTTYGIDRLVQNSRDDAESARRIIHWVHQQWQHDGLNEPSHSDALTILREAREGKQFRCVEYAIVTTACLAAVGLNARTVGLYSHDVETKPVAAAHVVTEVFLKDFQKWAYVDAEWDVMPVENGFPLNAIELGKAIDRNDPDLTIMSQSGTTKAAYLEWIQPYLYYLDVAVDNSQTVAGTDFNSKEAPRLMLVPLGAKEPRIFQRHFRIDNCFYTNSETDFYEDPADSVSTP